MREKYLRGAINGCPIVFLTNKFMTMTTSGNVTYEIYFLIDNMKAFNETVNIIFSKSKLWLKILEILKEIIDLAIVSLEKRGLWSIYFY